ncbi:MAG TPA: FKBP-type peptidyl-prolyl cis-trans isomerase [Gemmatimonadales bacterium]
MLQLRRIALLVSLFGSGCLATDSAATVEETDFAASLGVDLAASTKGSSGLYYRDLVAGTGAVVATGQHLLVHYTGWLANGTQFDSNVAGQNPYPFQLGAGEVIQGWDLGIPGMHIGGTRQLLLPPGVAYGANGYGTIPGNAVLVFTVEVVSAQ